MLRTTLFPLDVICIFLDRKRKLLSLSTVVFFFGECEIRIAGCNLNGFKCEFRPWFEFAAAFRK